MPPQISSSPQRSDFADEGQGGFLTQKLGPVPMWAVIAGALVVLYVLYIKFFSGTNSTSNPAVTATPDQTAAPYTNLDSALAQVQANEQQIQSLLGTGASSTMNNTPAAAVTNTASTYNPSHTTPSTSGPYTNYSGNGTPSIPKTTTPTTSKPTWVEEAQPLAAAIQASRTPVTGSGYKPQPIISKPMAPTPIPVVKTGHYSF